MNASFVEGPIGAFAECSALAIELRAHGVDYHRPAVARN
jgi:hypothetical protein